MMTAQELLTKAEAQYIALAAQMAPGVAKMAEEEAQSALAVILSGKIKEGLRPIYVNLDDASLLAQLDAQATQEAVDVDASADKLTTERAWGKAAGGVAISLLVAFLGL